ncbi:hypothetical protein HRbin10_00127 [bacterium HR10]|nr:hypothetical protein HRbin10_00127 [bacterium HR10]
MVRRLGISALLGLALGLLGELSPLLAQCAMCRTAVAGSSRLGEIARVLNTAILALLIPPVAILGLVFWLAVTVWNRAEDDRSGESREIEAHET